MLFRSELLAEAKNEIYNGLPIEIKFTSNPEEILNKSKVFISTQLFNNYPSRSLVEALAAGNLPVVTDNGQTRWIAKENFSYYVKEDFSETDIADAVYEIMKLDNNAFIEKANIARVFVTTNHTLKKMSNYFQEKIYA